MTKPQLAVPSPWGPNARHYGHPKKPDVKVPSVTTILKYGVPKPFLMPWAAKITAETAVDEARYWLKDLPLESRCQDGGCGHYGTQIHVETGPIIDPQICRRHARVNWLKRAHTRTSGKAANAGDHAHEYLDLALTGQRISDMKRKLADGFAPVIDRLIERWTPDVIESEYTFFSETHGYGGTGDNILFIPALGVIAVDAKSSASGIYSDVGLQISAARYADYIIERAGRVGSGKWREREIPKTPGGGYALHLRPECRSRACKHRPEDDCQGRPEGFADFIPVKADEESFEVFLSAKNVAMWRNGPDREMVGAPVNPPNGLPSQRPTSLYDEMLQRKNQVVEISDEAADDLAEQWPEDIPTFSEAKREKYTFAAHELLTIGNVISIMEMAWDLPFTLSPFRAKPIQPHDVAIRAPELPDELAEIAAKGGRVKQAKIEKLRERFQALPRDIAGEVEQARKRLDIDGNSNDLANHSAMRHLVDIGEGVHELRLDTMALCMANLKLEQRAQIMTGVFPSFNLDGLSKPSKIEKRIERKIRQLTDVEAITLQAVASSVSSGWLIVRTADAKEQRMGAFERENARLAKARLVSLERRYGNRTSIRAAAIEFVQRYELDIPVAAGAPAIAAHPILSALLLHVAPAEREAWSMSSAEALAIVKKAEDRQRAKQKAKLKEEEE